MNQPVMAQKPRADPLCATGGGCIREKCGTGTGRSPPQENGPVVFEAEVADRRR